MSSTEKIQLKTQGEGDKKESSAKRRPGRPKKEVDMEIKIQLLKEFISKLENVTNDGEKYIVKNIILNTKNNIDLVQEFIPKFRKVFVYPRFNSILRSDNCVVRCLKTICKLVDIKTETFIYEGKTNMFVFL